MISGMKEIDLKEIVDKVTQDYKETIRLLEAYDRNRVSLECHRDKHVECSICACNCHYFLPNKW